MSAAPGTALGRFGDVARLAELIARCEESDSDYYGRHFAAGQGSPTSVIEAWSDVPTTSKAEVLDDQQVAPPYGSRLLVPVSDLRLVVESSGSTSGVKEVHVLTAEDEATVIDMMAAAFRRIGLGSTDIVALTLPLSTAGGGAKVYHTLRSIGALALRIGSLSTAEKVAELRQFRPTAIVATPSYLDRLAVALRDVGTRPDEIGLQRLLVATQAVSVDWVRRTEQVWGAKVFEWYGNASGFFAMSCSRGVLDGSEWGTLHWDGTFQLLELLDADGRLVAHGEVGEMVGTHLANSTSPLIRYRLGDEAELVDAGRCACGGALPGLRAGSIRRADGMVKFRGVSLWPSAVDRVLAEVSGVDSSWVVLRQDDAAVEIAELFVRSAAADFDYVGLGELMRARTGVRFDVTPWPHQDAPPPCQVVTASGKSPRWVDTRQVAVRESSNHHEGASK